MEPLPPSRDNWTTTSCRTALAGKYDFPLDWIPDGGSCGDGSARRSIFTAVKEQLRLKLESGKGPVGTLVIDRIERPTEN